MKCLSLWQPWASLIMVGAKRFETRSWGTAYRGPLLIHAAKKWYDGLRRMCSHEPFLRVMDKHGIFPTDGCPVERFLPLGCILGVADLVECYESSGEELMSERGIIPMPSGNEWEFGDFSEGRFAWQLANVRRFTAPIPYRGEQGLFDVADQVVAAQIATAGGAG